MQLFIGNASKQKHMFQFRAPENARLQFVPVPAGSQVMAFEGSTEACDAIVAQHREYGIADVKAFEKLPKFSGIVYSMGKKIDMVKLAHAREIRGELMDLSAQEVREATAAATDANIEQHAADSNSVVERTALELEELPNDQFDGRKRMRQNIIADKNSREKVSRSAKAPRVSH